MKERSEYDFPRGGRPPIYKSPADLQKKIEQYFSEGLYRKREIVVGNKKTGYRTIKIPIITITDLVLYLGFSNRASFYDYEERKGFSDTIKRARSFIEREYEEMLNTGNVTGAIFALKNFGWEDSKSINIDTKSIDESLNKLVNISERLKNGSTTNESEHPAD